MRTAATATSGQAEGEEGLAAAASTNGAVVSDGISGGGAGSRPRLHWARFPNMTMLPRCGLARDVTKLSHCVHDPARIGASPKTRVRGGGWCGGALGLLRHAFSNASSHARIAAIWRPTAPSLCSLSRLWRTAATMRVSGAPCRPIDRHAVSDSFAQLSGQNRLISNVPKDDDHDRQRQAEPPVVAEAIAAGSHHQRVALVPDRREEVAAGADRDRHQERVGVQSRACRPGWPRSAPSPGRSRHC